jgi:putative membrane protein insertion efficiency factor
VKRWPNCDHHAREGTRGVILALLLVPLRLYQRLISPTLPRRCKYHPTCSAYAAQALRELGPAKGTIVAAWRVARCNPLSDGGYDPLERRTLFRSAGARSGEGGIAT